MSISTSISTSMSRPKNWKPLARISGWLRAPQPRSGAAWCDPGLDADLRRARTDLDAVRARFPGPA